MFGIASIVASLIFVGIQLRLEQRVALASQYHARAESRLETIRTLFGNESYLQDVATRFDRGQKPPWWNTEIEDYVEEFDAPFLEALRTSFVAQMSIIAFDNNYYQYQEGFSDEGVWNSLRTALKNSLSNPINYAVYQSNVSRPEMQKLLSDLKAELESER